MQKYIIRRLCRSGWDEAKHESFMCGPAGYLHIAGHEADEAADILEKTWSVRIALRVRDRVVDAVAARPFNDMYVSAGGYDTDYVDIILIDTGRGILMPA